MSNPDVREIGTVHDLYGARVTVGVDCDAVTIRAPGGATLGPGVRDGFAKLYFAADEAAKAWAVANRDDEAELLDRAAMPQQVSG